MRDFFVRDTAETWPFKCFCGSQAGPIVDTYIDLPQGMGRVYVCAHCVERCARALEWRSPSDALEQDEHVARLREQIAFLEVELERERSPESKVVSLTEILAAVSTPAPPSAA